MFLGELATVIAGGPCCFSGGCQGQYLPVSLVSASQCSSSLLPGRAQAWLSASGSRVGGREEGSRSLPRHPVLRKVPPYFRCAWCPPVVPLQAVRHLHYGAGAGRSPGQRSRGRTVEEVCIAAQQDYPGNECFRIQFSLCYCSWFLWVGIWPQAQDVPCLCCVGLRPSARMLAGDIFRCLALLVTCRLASKGERS